MLNNWLIAYMKEAHTHTNTHISMRNFQNSLIKPFCPLNEFIDTDNVESSGSLSLFFETKKWNNSYQRCRLTFNDQEFASTFRLRYIRSSCELFIYVCIYFRHSQPAKGIKSAPEAARKVTRVREGGSLSAT